MSDGLNHDNTRKVVRVSSLFAGVITLIPGALMLADAAMGFGWLGYTGGELFSPTATKLLIGLMAVAISGHIIETNAKRMKSEDVLPQSLGSYTRPPLGKHTPDLS